MNKCLRILSLLVALSLMFLTLPAAMAESGVKAVVSADKMNVYDTAAPHALLGSLPKGTEVLVTARNGEAALISYGGRQGIARIGDMQRAQEAAAEESGTAMVASRDTRVYTRASTSSSYRDVKKGDPVEVLAVNGNCARVKVGGKVGYMVYGHLGEPGSVLQTVAEPVTAVNAQAVTNRDARVYADAALSGQSVAVGKGVSLTVLAVRGDCAMVERGGAIGYMAVSALSRDSGTAKQAAKAESNPFPSGSNERVIYSFLTGEMGYNRAAAMGVMANIRYESSYNPNCNGDGGTSYGICQWHAGRKTNLIAYCEEQGLDYTTLEGQLRFLKYELANKYPSVHSYMKQVENSADGAYDAAYYFCFNYEAPAARTSQSTQRGNYAKDTLWEK